MINWIQARKAFLLKAAMTLVEACAAHETEITLANNRRKQQEICADLKKEVRSITQPHKSMLLIVSWLVQYLLEKKIHNVGSAP